MSDEIEFVDGVFAKAPHGNAPDFIKGKLSIKLSDFAQYLRDLKAKDPKAEWLNIDIKESQAGKWYVARDNWVPDANYSSAPAPAPVAAPHGYQSAVDDSDLPF